MLLQTWYRYLPHEILDASPMKLCPWIQCGLILNFQPEMIPLIDATQPNSFYIHLKYCVFTLTHTFRNFSLPAPLFLSRHTFYLSTDDKNSCEFFSTLSQYTEYFLPIQYTRVHISFREVLSTYPQLKTYYILRNLILP